MDSHSHGFKSTLSIKDSIVKKTYPDLNKYTSPDLLREPEPSSLSMQSIDRDPSHRALFPTKPAKRHNIYNSTNSTLDIHNSCLNKSDTKSDYELRFYGSSTEQDVGKNKNPAPLTVRVLGVDKPTGGAKANNISRTNSLSFSSSEVRPNHLQFKLSFDQKSSKNSSQDNFRTARKSENYKLIYSDTERHEFEYSSKNPCRLEPHTAGVLRTGQNKQSEETGNPTSIKKHRLFFINPPTNTAASSMKSKSNTKDSNSASTYFNKSTLISDNEEFKPVSYLNYNSNTSNNTNENQKKNESAKKPSILEHYSSKSKKPSGSYFLNSQENNITTGRYHSPIPRIPCNANQYNTFTKRETDDDFSSPTRKYNFSSSTNQNLTPSYTYLKKQEPQDAYSPSTYIANCTSYSACSTNSSSFIKVPRQSDSSITTAVSQKRTDLYDLSPGWQMTQAPVREHKITDFYKGRCLGTGKYGSVFAAKHKETGFLCAIKVIEKKAVIKENMVDQISRELKIHSYVDHPQVISLYGFFADALHLYLMLELCTGGQVYDLLKYDRRITEERTSEIVKSVSEGVTYLHACNILHRDIKPQNIVLQFGVAKICDLGWSVYDPNGLRRTFCGTPLYLSPELLKGQSYDEKCDIWAIGILTYQLIYGMTPFKIFCQTDVMRILSDQITFPSWVDVSKDCLSFISMILVKDPFERGGIRELLQHPFLNRSVKSVNSKTNIDLLKNTNKYAVEFGSLF